MEPRNPEGQSRPQSGSLRARAGRATRLALAFLTVIPLRGAAFEPTEADLAASRFAYPLVGAAIGLAMAVLGELLRRAGAEPGLSAFLLVVALAMVSGGLHLDGLADSFDGLFLFGGAERRLAVMRDPHLGSHGASAIVLVLLGKYAALSSLNGPERARALFVAIAVGRTLILVSAGLADYARPQGTGRHVVAATTRRDACFAMLLILAISAALAGSVGLIAGVAALILALCLTRLSVNRLGGVTGDILGALVELGELTFLVGWCLVRVFGRNL